MKRLRLLHLACLVALLGLAPAAFAHKPSDAYLQLDLRDGGLHGRWDLALRDLEAAVGLDADADGAITWGELQRQRDAVAAYALARLELQAGTTPLTLKCQDLLVEQHSDGAYAVLPFTALPSPSTPAISWDRVVVTYRAFFDLDPTHRGLLRLTRGSMTSTAVFGPDQPRQELVLGTGAVTRFGDFVKEGVEHIWMGFDHVLFLLALLLPRVLRREAGEWRPVGDFRTVLTGVVRIVTAFTLAHSITLSLAALELVRLPSRLVESIIAASVVLAAVNNLRPMFAERTWVVAFGFGLIHGFGFAGALADLGLRQGALVQTLLGFNLGVELGQLAIVALFLPVAFLLRGGWFYPRVALRLGSTMVALLASLWMIERMFNLRLLPGG